MYLIAFVTPCVLHRVCPARSKTRDLRRSILACEKRPKLSRSGQTSAPQNKSSKNANLFLDPKSAPSLLRSPASILTVAAIGFLTAAAFLTRAARRFTADIAARTKLLLSSRVLRERLFARVRERTFLQSALDATNVTLENTQSYLDAQRERATVAENRLQKLQSQRDDLRELERRREVLLQQVSNCEDELAQNEQNSRTNKRKADEARRELDTLRKRLADLDAQCDDATVELADLECAAFDALDLVQKAAEERRTKLEETTRLIDKARSVKRRTDAESNDFLKKVDQLNESVSSALSQVEEQRRLINDMTQRAEFIKSEIKRKRKDTHFLPDTSTSTMRMKSLLDDVGNQQQAVRQALSELEGRRNRELEEYDALTQKLALREQQVLQLKKKLFLDESVPEAADVFVEQENADSQRQTNVSKEINIMPLQDSGLNMTQDQWPSIEGRERVEDDETADGNFEGEATLSRPGVFSETNVGDSSVQDSLEGSYGDMQIAPVLELLEENEKSSPKPKRGRRSGTESANAVPSTDKSKRRGRPRETGTSAPSSETSVTSGGETKPKRRRGRPRKNEVMSNP